MVFHTPKVIFLEWLLFCDKKLIVIELEEDEKEDEGAAKV